MEFVVQPVNEGDIVIRKGIGGETLKYLDPFVLFADFSMSSPAGFNDHPHRGFDSLTYVLEGGIGYKDSKAHQAIISSGDIQWMRTGRGIIHSEMAAGEGVNRAIQVWINVPSTCRMEEPECMEVQHQHIAVEKDQGLTIKTMADEHWIRSPTRTPIIFMEYMLDPAAYLSRKLPEGWNGFVYVLEGEGEFGPPDERVRPSGSHSLVVLRSSWEGLIARNCDSSMTLRFVLVAGQPVNEPMVQHGPFVMSTREEIDQTIQDYRNRRNGF